MSIKSAFNINAPAIALRSVSPSDTVDLADGPCRALTCLVSGIAVVIAAGDQNSQQIYLIAGVPFPVQATRVLLTNTTATGIVAMY